MLFEAPFMLPSQEQLFGAHSYNGKKSTKGQNRGLRAGALVPLELQPRPPAARPPRTTLATTPAPPVAVSPHKAAPRASARWLVGAYRGKPATGQFGLHLVAPNSGGADTLEDHTPCPECNLPVGDWGYCAADSEGAQILLHGECEAQRCYGRHRRRNSRTIKKRPCANRNAGKLSVSVGSRRVPSPKACHSPGNGVAGPCRSTCVAWRWMKRHGACGSFRRQIRRRP